MKPEALAGLILICVLGLPCLAWLVLRRVDGLRLVPTWAWLGLYAIAFLLQPLFLLRKHWEGALTLAYPTFAGYMLIQVDNEFWEEAAKLVAILLAARGVARRLPALLARPSALAALGFWVGLAYGLGEAVMLAVLIMHPALNPLFGLSLFSPYLVGLAYVYERFWAVQVHAVLGGLVGLGVWTAYRSGALRPRGGLVLCLLAAMLYHHLVDGIIITAQFFPAVGQWLQGAAAWWLIPLVALGYGALLLAVSGLEWRARRESVKPSAPWVQTQKGTFP